jgi:PAS domain S-box-containing protein
MAPSGPTDQRRKPAGAAAEQRAAQPRAKSATRRGGGTYRALFRNMPVPMQAVDENARLLEVNDAWLKLLGYAREEVIGRHLTEFYTPESAGDFDAQGWPRLLKTGEAHDLERHLRAKSGAIVTVLLSASIERDAAGRFVRGYATLIDVSARRKLEHEREHYFDMAQDFLTISGFDGVLHDVNPAAIAAVGRSREQVLATPFFEFLHPDDHAAVRAGMARLRAGTPVSDTEVRYRYKDGSWRWSAWRSAALAKEGLIFSVGRDIHDQRQAEEALRRSERLDAIGQLTGGIAHDFNNLLTIVIGNVDRIMSSATADDRTKHLAEVALEAAERGARLTEHLLAFARQQRLEPQVLHLADLLLRMEPLYRRAVGEAIELQMTLSTDLWPCRADAGRLETAILNLVLNARDAMPEGGRVGIDAANLSVAAPGTELLPGDYVVIRVRDTGRGMPAAVAARAFEPFFSTKPVGQGTGLGLSMVYGFAKQSGGMARIESSAGAGTTVSLCLPRAKEDAPAAEAEPAPAGEARPATILVVEDEPAVREVTAEVLTELGHRVLTAGDGAAALRVLRQEAKVDLLITDIVMPGGVSGVALASNARQAWPQLRVLLITGYGVDTGGELIETGDFDVLRKPYRPARLSAMVQEILRRPPQ